MAVLVRVAAVALVVLCLSVVSIAVYVVALVVGAGVAVPDFAVPDDANRSEMRDELREFAGDGAGVHAGLSGHDQHGCGGEAVPHHGPTASIGEFWWHLDGVHLFGDWDDFGGEPIGDGAGGVAGQQ